MLLGLFLVRFIYTSLFARRQQQQVKKAPNTQQQKQTNKREKNYAQIGRTSEQCYQILYTNEL